MQALGDGLISAVDQLSSRLGPLARLIDAVVDRIAPKATVHATCPPPGYCYIKCSTTCCANCGGDAKYFEYAYYGTGCASKCVYDCTNLC
jgi:hypothetical protein